MDNNYVNSDDNCLITAVADPGFSVGGGTDPLGGRQPPTHTLFGENIRENERN